MHFAFPFFFFAKLCKNPRLKIFVNLWLLKSFGNGLVNMLLLLIYKNHEIYMQFNFCLQKFVFNILFIFTATCNTCLTENGESNYFKKWIMKFWNCFIKINAEDLHFQQAQTWFKFSSGISALLKFTKLHTVLLSKFMFSVCCDKVVFIGITICNNLQVFSSTCHFTSYFLNAFCLTSDLLRFSQMKSNLWCAINFLWFFHLLFLCSITPWQL